MNHAVNLMTEQARNRTAAQRLIRSWALVLGAMIAAATPLGAWAWQRRSGVMQIQQALEAKYEPMRRLAAENRRLTVAAAQLVKNERITLELSRERPAATLLQVIGEAVAAADGNVFVERISAVHQPLAEAGAETAGRVVIDVTCVEGYDVARLAFALKRPPLRAVKVVSSESGSAGEHTVDRHSLECEF